MGTLSTLATGRRFAIGVALAIVSTLLLAQSALHRTAVTHAAASRANGHAPAVSAATAPAAAVVPPKSQSLAKSGPVATRQAHPLTRVVVSRPAAGRAAVVSWMPRARSAAPASTPLALAAGPAARPSVASDANADANADVDRRADRLLGRPSLQAPSTVTMTSATSYVSLSADRDYVIKVQPGTVFSRPVTIAGGRNVVFENTVMHYVPPLGAPPGWIVRGLYLVDQTGVMWVKNLQIRGPLSEGIDLSQKKNASVVLQSITIDPVTGSKDTNHADLLQTWAGPGRLVVDGLTGTSNFQGVFLQPADTWNGPDPEFLVLRHIDIDVSKGIYALSSYSHGAYPVLGEDITVKYNPARPGRDQWLWPKPSTGDKTWSGVVGVGR